MNKLGSFFRSIISGMNSKNSENGEIEAWCLALYLATRVTHFSCSSYVSFETIGLINDEKSKCPKRVQYSGVSLISDMILHKFYSRLWSLLLSNGKNSTFNTISFIQAFPKDLKSPRWVVCIWSLIACRQDSVPGHFMRSNSPRLTCSAHS